MTEIRERLPKWNPNGLYILPDGTQLNGGQFGNWLAGYVAYYHFGPLGYAVAAAGGEPYAVAERARAALDNIANGRPLWESVSSPYLGTWRDCPMDQYLIRKGADDAAKTGKGEIWDMVLTNMARWGTY